MSKFLITGGAGFIGSNIAEELAAQGHYVRVLDNFFSGKKENLDFAKGLGKTKFELIKGDITSPADCAKACRGIDYVFHQAGLRSIPESLKNPLAYNKVNIDGILNMLQASSKAGVKRFVFASSSSVYGDAVHFPQNENDMPLLMTPYALTKLTGEYYCRVFAESYGLETVALRYFNVFGPRQALDDQYAVVIPKFIHCIINNERPPIFGNGKQSRDFTYIKNIVDGNILAATTPGIKHEVLNIAMGRGTTVLELANTINKITGKNIKPKFLPIRKGDIFKSNADIAKIKKILKFKPAVSFEDGLKETVAYFRNQWGK